MDAPPSPRRGAAVGDKIDGSAGPGAAPSPRLSVSPRERTTLDHLARPRMSGAAATGTIAAQTAPQQDAATSSPSSRELRRQRAAADAHRELTFRPATNPTSAGMVATTFAQRQQQFLDRRRALERQHNLPPVRSPKAVRERVRRALSWAGSPSPQALSKDRDKVDEADAATGSGIPIPGHSGGDGARESSSLEGASAAPNEAVEADAQSPRPQKAASPRKMQSPSIRTKARDPSGGAAAMTPTASEGPKKSRRSRERASSFSSGDCSCASSTCEHPSHKRNIRAVPPPVSHERMAELKEARHAREIAIDAAQEQKIFTIYGGYPDIRDAFLERGWVEKRAPRDGMVFPPNTDFSGTKVQKLKPNLETPGQDLEEKVSELTLTERALAEQPANFIWTCKRDHIDFRSLRPHQVANHFHENAFITTKVGLARAMRGLPWYEEKHPDTIYPRCHYLNTEEELLDFVDDFRVTAAQAILQRVCEWSPSVGVLQLAFRACELYVGIKRHCDLDLGSASEESNCVFKESASAAAQDVLTDTEWEALLRFTYDKLNCLHINRPKEIAPKASPSGESSSEDEGEGDAQTEETAASLHKSQATGSSASDMSSGGGGQDSSLQAPKAAGSKARNEMEERRKIEAIVRRLTSEPLVEAATALLKTLESSSTEKAGAPSSSQISAMCEELRVINLQFDSDGFHNAWVVKPAAKSRGRGIFCENRLDFILSVLVDGSQLEKWVAQKYMERPLLVNGTKFDIRQWVLVRSWNPLVIWFYKDCYLRFSSVPFSLDDLHSEKSKHVHLCNNSIQKDSEEFEKVSFAKECMWPSSAFEEWLAEQGHADAWESKIYPGMKEVTISAMRCAQDAIESRKNSFEVFGLDFMIDTEFNVWLIEINSSPDMLHSTEVTGALVPGMSRDILKVLLDRKKNKTADTGRFELIVKQDFVAPPLSSISRDLFVQGAPMRRKQAPNCSPTKARGSRAEPGDGAGGGLAPLSVVTGKSLL